MKKSAFMGVILVFLLSSGGYCDKYRELKDFVVSQQDERKIKFESENPNLSYVWKFVGFKDFPDCSGETVRSSGDVLRGMFKPIGCSEGGYQEKGVMVINKDTYEADGSIFVYVGVVSWSQGEATNNPAKHYRLWKYEYKISEDSWYSYNDPDRHVTCRLVKRNKTVKFNSQWEGGKANGQYSGMVEEEECSCGGGGGGGGILDWLFGK